VIAVGPRWFTIVRDDEREAILVLSANVQRVEVPDVQVNSAAELGYAGVFGFERQWKGEEAEALRVMGGGV
jgi:hypothetical protein